MREFLFEGSELQKSENLHFSEDSAVSENDAEDLEKNAQCLKLDKMQKLKI